MPGGVALEAPGATEIHAPGGAVLPGLIDAHVHLAVKGGQVITDRRNAC